MTNRLLLFIPFFILFSCNSNKNEEKQEVPAIQNPGQQSSIAMEEEEMMKAATQNSAENPYKEATIEVKTFKDSLGWGYDVFINNSQYVHQPHIPAVPGNRGFSTEAFARKTGEYVGFKIKNNIMPPSVTPAELDSLGVLK